MDGDGTNTGSISFGFSTPNVEQRFFKLAPNNK